MKKGNFLFSLFATAALIALALATNALLSERLDAQLVSIASKQIPSIPPAQNQPADPLFDLRNLSNDIIRRKSKPTDLLAPLLTQREQLLLDLLEKNPRALPAVLFGDKDLAAFPSPLRQKVEKKVEQEGILEVVHIDEKEPKYVYSLKMTNKKSRLYFIPDDPSLISGARIRVKGIEITPGNVLAGATSENLTVIKPAPPSPTGANGGTSRQTRGEEKTAVLLMRFSDSGDFPFTPDDIREGIFNGQVQNFYQENSYGNVVFSGDVFGWYTLPTGCNTYGTVWINEAISAADAEVNFLNYSRIIILSDSFCRGDSFGPYGAGSVGMVDLTSDDGMFRASWATVANARYFFDEVPYPSGGARPYSWTSGFGLVVHELGHNFGTHHANNWECGRTSVYGDCVHGEYGNFFDSMGRPWNTGGIPPEIHQHTNAAFHLNAYFKNIAGWLGERLRSITTSGTYTLRPLEQPDAIAAVIEQPSYPKIPPLYLEYRAPVGYDDGLNDPLAASNLESIFLNRLRKDPYGGVWSLGTRLIDVIPTTNGQYDTDWYPVALQPARTFTDEGSGISIKNLGVNSGELTLEVQISEPKCLRLKPGMPWFYYNFTDASAGALVRFIYFLRNSDSEVCAASVFSIRGEVPTGWSFYLDVPRLPFSPAPIGKPIILAPDEIFGGVASIAVPPDAAPGCYGILVHFKNNDSGLSHIEKVSVRVTNPDGTFPICPQR